MERALVCEQTIGRPGCELGIMRGLEPQEKWKSRQSFHPDGFHMPKLPAPNTRRRQSVSVRGSRFGLTLDRDFQKSVIHPGSDPLCLVFPTF